MAEWIKGNELKKFNSTNQNQYNFKNKIYIIKNKGKKLNSQQHEGSKINVSTKP